jgi:hypothetical protein
MAGRLQMVEHHMIAHEQTYHWLMTNHVLVKKNVVKDTDGNAGCVCGRAKRMARSVTCKKKKNGTLLFGNDM